MPRNLTVVFGGSGLVGSAIVRGLVRQSSSPIAAPSHRELDLTDQAQVRDWMSEKRPSHVYLVAGTVGGIKANSTRPAEFIYDNIMIHANVIDAAHKCDVEKLLYLGSSCIYPKFAPQPIKEEHLLTGILEPTNESYALAKISGIKMCSSYRDQYGCNFISAMPTNLYGPGDNFDSDGGHVIPALIQKFHSAKMSGIGHVMAWGTGTPRREFLHVDDLADACLFLMDRYDEREHINVGSGQEVTIRELCELVRDVVYPGCEIRWDSSMPDGTPRKLLDSTRLVSMGWSPSRELKQSLAQTYDWFQTNIL
jgi:GDP-L-fucose synthase